MQHVKALYSSVVLLEVILLTCCFDNVVPLSSSVPRRGSRRSRHTALLSLKDTTTAVPSPSSPPKEPLLVVIVGGGVGGLAIASRIAAACRGDCRVTLLEKNEETGGRCGSFNASVPNFGTFRHERGPSLLLLPQVYRDLFTDTVNQTAQDYGLDLVQCVPAYQVVFDDGDRIDLGFPTHGGEDVAELERLSRAKMDSYEPHGATKWDEYMKLCEAFLDCGWPNFIEEQLDMASFPAFLRASLKDFGKAWPLKSHSAVLDAIFSSNKMRALASFQDLYVGLEPFTNKNLLAGGVFETTAPAVFGLLAAIELHPGNKRAGVFAPTGGFQSVAAGMERLARDLGVRIKCGCTVASVANDGVYYIDTNDTSSKNTPTFEPSDFVVVNADLPYATESLLKQQEGCSVPKYDWDDTYRFSCGVVAFHWSVSKALDDLNTHNVFLSTSSRADAEASWKALRDDDSANGELPFSSPNDPFNFYVHRASKTDPTAAPQGMDSLLVLVPCPTLARNKACGSMRREKAMQEYKKQFDEQFLSRAREAVFERMAAIDSLQDLKTMVVHEVVDTPATYADQYNVGAGTPFALSHGLAQLSVMRPGPFSSHLPNVCFCGASSRPGNGVPLVLTGAKLVAEQVVAKLKRLWG